MGCTCSDDSEQPSKGDFVTESHFDQVLTEFHHPEKYDDIFEAFPQLESLEKVTSKKYPGYNLLLCQRTDAKTKAIEFLEYWTSKQQDFNHPNLLMIQILSSFSYPSLVVPLQRVCFLIEYPEQVLSCHPQIMNDMPLDESEIWFILDCVLAALAYCQDRKFRCANMTLNDIYIVKTHFGLRMYKIADSFFKPSEVVGLLRLIESEKDMEFDKHMLRQVVLSPLQIDSVRERNKYPKQDIYKSQVFVLGMLMLYCLDLESNADAYDWIEFEVRSEYLERRLNSLNQSNQVSIILLQFIERMLQIDENMRLDFIKLSNELTVLFHKYGKKRLLGVYFPNDFIYHSNTPTRRPDEYQGLTTEDFIWRPENAKYKFQLGQLSKSLVIHKSRNLLDSEDISPRQQIAKEPFEVEKIATHSPIPNEQVVGKSKSDTFLLSNSEFTNNQVQSKSSLGFVLYPYPMVTSKSVAQSLKEEREGKYVYSTGSYYVGRMVNGRRCGKGTLYDENGEKLVEGDWDDDMPNGYVVLYNQPYSQQQPISHEEIDNTQWLKYDGQVRNGYKHGKGILYYSCGDVFDGKFLNDQAQGAGYYQYSNGNYLEGVWDNGRFV